MSGFAARAALVQERIREACARCGREASSVELLPVSKFHPASAVQEALACGFRCFGENYVQEGAAKACALPEARFVLIGPLQRNKAKAALEAFQEILSVDRPELAARLARLAEELGLRRRAWIQVDLWDEATKLGGCPEAGIPAVVEALAGALPLAGFMAIPPPGHPTAFSQLAELRARWQERLGQPLRLSMGMSEDLEAAIAAGSDQVRIGTALFGERPIRT